MTEPVFAEQLKKELLADIRSILRDLWKILKALSIYPPESPTPRKMREAFGARFVELISQYGEIRIAVKPKELLYENENVYQDNGQEDTLASLLCSAGLVDLNFSDSLKIWEADRFIDAVKAYLAAPPDDRDLISLLWQEQFESISFQTVDDLELDNFNAGRIIEEYLPHVTDTAADVSESLFRTITLDDPNEESKDEGDVWKELSGEDDPSAKGMSRISFGRDDLFRDSYLPAEDEQVEISRILADDRNFDHNRYVTRLMLEIQQLCDNPKLQAESVAICEKTLDQLLSAGAFAPAAEFVQALRARYDEIRSKSPAYAERLNELLRAAGDSRRIQHLTDILNQKEAWDVGTITIYLESLGWESLTHVTAMLGKLVTKRARLLVCEFLVSHCRSRLPIIGNCVTDKRWYVVRNAAMILGQIGGDQVLPYLSSASTHPDNRVRRETLKALVEIGTEKAVAVLIRFLDDPESRLRSTCLYHLGKIGGRRGFELLQSKITSKEFTEIPLEDQEQFLAAFSRLGGAEVVPYLCSLVESFTLIPTAQRRQRKLAALRALAHNRSTEAESKLRQLAKSGAGWLRATAAAALEHRGASLQKGDDGGEFSSD